MSDDTTTDPTVDDPRTDSPEEPDQPDRGDASKGEEPFDQDRAMAKIRKANSEAAKLRERVKQLEPLAQKAQELEDASKTETEKLTERLTASERRAQDAELRALRLEVAAEKGLTPAQARRLVGASKEELEADADDLLATFAPKPQSSTGKVPDRPREKLRGGGDPDEPVEETDPRKLAALIRRGK
jgi:hypothetical protein